jgi:hypothetical protein
MIKNEAWMIMSCALPTNQSHALYLQKVYDSDRFDRDKTLIFNTKNQAIEKLIDCLIDMKDKESR